VRAEGTLVLSDGDFVAIANDQGLELVSSPDALGGHAKTAEANVVWRGTSRRAGDALVELAYRADHLVATAEHAIVLTRESAAVDTWITIENDSGFDFHDVDLRVDDIDVRRVSLHAGSTQIALPGRHATARRELRFEPFPAPLVEVDAAQRVDPSYGVAAGGALTEELVMQLPAGTALPAGMAHVYERDDDDTPVLLAEAALDATLAGDTLRVPLSDVDDVRAQRRRIWYRWLGPHKLAEKFAVVCTSTRDRPARIHVVEHAIRSKSFTVRGDESFAIQGSQIDFSVDIPPGTTRRLTYELVYGL
jgi:hypothetical protein